MLLSEITALLNSIVWQLISEKFRGDVDGYPFKIAPVTDRASLKWLMSQKDLAGRLARWSLKLQGFDFTIEHRKGRANVIPDALSRVYMDELTPNPCMALDLASAHFDGESNSKMREVQVNIRTEPCSDLPTVPNLEIEGL